MRDPDLVQRAEQAATALEQAWMRWRVRHGLGTGPLPPVSSYVGYSVEEPWGQPRVVLGVEAAEAERLAAILDGHECVEPNGAGPNGAEPAGLPRPRQPAELEPAPAKTVPDTELAAEVQPSGNALPESGPLAASPAQPGRTGGRSPRSSRPAPPQTTTPATPAKDATAAAGVRPSESPAQVAARLRELAARVTSLHPRSDVRDDQPQPAADSAV
jgi:hypothetical protein